MNNLDFELSSIKCPLVYPFLINDSHLKQILIKNKIFIATYWPNVLEWCEETDIEYYLTQNIISLPIDQRYDLNDMSRIVSIIQKYKK